MALLSLRYRFKSLWKRILMFCFDQAGTVFALPFGLSKKTLTFHEVRKILVIRLDHIGDVVMTKPAIRALHKKFPHAEIDLLVSEEVAPLFRHAKEIRHVIQSPRSWFAKNISFGQSYREFFRLLNLIKKKHYDLGIDFRGDVRNILLMSMAGVGYRLGYGITGGGFLLHDNVPYDPAVHQVLSNLRLLESLHILHDNKLLPFEHSNEETSVFWQKAGKELSPSLKPRLILHMGSGYPSKRWPAEKFLELIYLLEKEELAQIVLIGTESEKAFMPDLKPLSDRLIDLRGKTQLSDLPVLFDASDLFVGNDSGPAHIAAAQGLEIVLLASGTNEIRYWYPWTEKLHIIQYEVPCSPCEAPVCPVDDHPCLENVTVSQVFETIRSVLARLQEK